MADQAEKLTLDASDLMSELARVQASFKAHAQSVNEIADVYVELNKTQKGVSGYFKMVTDAGQQLEGRLKRVKGEWEAQVRTIRESTKALKDNADAHSAAATKQGAVLAEQFLKQHPLPVLAAPSASLLSAQRTAQQQLAKAMGEDVVGVSTVVAGDIFAKLKAGIPEVEVGIRGRLQQALISLLRVEERITAEQKKRTTTGRISQQFQEQGADLAKQFLQAHPLTQMADMPASLLAAQQTAQQRLAKALSGDVGKGLETAEELFKKLKEGVKDVEIGIRGKIQQALISLLRVEERISAEQKKRGQVAPGGPSPAQLAATRTDVARLFPVPSGASTSSVLSFQSALNSLISTASRGKVPLESVRTIMAQIARNPTGNFAGNDIELQKVQVAAQRVSAAFEQMQKSAKAAANEGRQTGRSFLVTFDQLVRILEIQVVHRIFGNFVTGMQQSIGHAAELQTRISEIRTIAQQSGLSFQDLQTRVREVSDEFGKPQVQVAEALYQGFSNQVIRTSGDMQVLNEAMRLSRITVSSAESAMSSISTVMNAYGRTAGESADITDKLFKAVQIGRFRLEDISGAIGRVGAVSSQVGVSFEEMLGLLTSLTRQGVPVHEAMTQISGIMQSLLRPSAELRQIMLRTWGAEGGQVAIRAAGGLGNALRILTTEAAKANSGIAGLFPNLRAMRGALGAEAGGGFEQDVVQIRNAGPEAAAATTIVGESAGDAFRRELNKIHNYFTNDFGNNFIATIQRLSEPLGGLVNIFQQVGGAISDVVGVGVSLISFMTSIVTLGGSADVNLGTLIKGYLAWKAAIVAVNVAMTVSKAVVALHTSLVIAAENVTRAATAADTAKNMTTLMSTASTSANTVATAAATTATVAATTATAANTGTTFLSTTALYAQAAAARVAAIAMKALPFIAIAASIAYAIGAFDSIIQRFDSFNGRIQEAQKRTSELTNIMRREAQDQARLNQDQTNQIRDQITTTFQEVNTRISRLRLASEAMVETQRRNVEVSTDNMKVVVRTLHDVLAKQLSDTRKNINEAENDIKKSLHRVIEFADRESTQAFSRAMKVLSQRPEVISGLRPLTNEQQYVQYLTRQAQATQYQQQQRLIQERINQLRREANELVEKGDRDSMESARRKYEEIRKLTEQQWELETERGRTVTRERAEDEARHGGVVQARYPVNLEEQRRRMETLRQEEARAEEIFRRRQAEQQTVNSRRAEEQAARMRNFDEAAKRISDLSVTNRQGQIRPEYQGSGGVNLFGRRFQELQEATIARAREAGLGEERILQLQNSLGQQRIQLEAQIQREITNIQIREQAERARRAEEAMRQALQTANRMRDEALAAQRTNIPAIQGQLTGMLQTIQEAYPTMLERARSGNVDENGQPTAGAARTLKLVELARQYQQQQQEAQTALETYRTARGTDQEAGALERLRTAVEAASTSYREFIRVRFGGERVGTTGMTGDEISRRNTVAQDLVHGLTEAQANLVTANQRLEETRRQARNLTDQLAAMPAPLAAAAGGVANVGQQARDAAPHVQTMTQRLTELADVIDRLRRNPPVIPVPIAGGAGRAPEEHARGGLIGNVFAARGADDTLIFAKRGEFVVNPESTQRFYSQLVAINSNRMPRFAEGGPVTNTTIGDITINVNESSHPEATARTVLGKLKRELRRGNGRL